MSSVVPPISSSLVSIAMRTTEEMTAMTRGAPEAVMSTSVVMSVMVSRRSLPVIGSMVVFAIHIALDLIALVIEERCEMGLTRQRCKDRE